MRKYVALLLTVSATAFPQAHAWMDTLTLPTHEEGPPVLDPPFDPFQAQPFNYNYVYPYTMRIGFSNQIDSQNWRAVYLENDLLRCIILPDLGGHVYNCIDKVTGADMFYANTAIKKQFIALRGAWAAFGLESNFPIGHSWVSVSGVDYSYADHPDGSSSVWVANVDRVTGMQWRSEFILRPGVGVLEQHVTLENRTAVRRPYYWWSNAEYRLSSGQDRFLMPTHVASVHGSNVVDTWPKSVSGTDYSIVGNYVDGRGYFSIGSNEAYHGFYQPAARQGLLHVASPIDVPGKKTWTWGPDQWSNANLSDDYSTYVEVQAGATVSQTVFQYLQPQQILNFTEYWLPIRFVSGVSKGNQSAIVNLVRTAAGSIKAEVAVTTALPAASLQLWQDGALLQESAGIDLSPSEMATINNTAPSASPVTFRLLDNSGSLLLEYTEGFLDASDASAYTLGAQPIPTWQTNPSTEDDYLLLADYDERNSNYDAALNDYINGLKTHPNSQSLSKGYGRLLLLLDNPSAKTQLQNSSAADPETQYYAALANQDAAALAALQSDPLFGTAAAIRVAELKASGGDATGALGSINQNLTSVRAGAIQVTLLRVTGDQQSAASQLATWLAVDPTDAVLHYESFTQGNDESDFWLHLAADPERVLNVAEHYIRLGQFTDALNVLSYDFASVDPSQMEPGIPSPQKHPLIWYYRGYCKEKLGQSGTTEYKTAAALPVTYIFPNRPITIDVLNAALRSNAQDASASWLLGCVLLSQRRTDEAIAVWNPLRTLRPSIPSLQRTLGRTWLDIKGDPNTAFPILQEGLKYEPDSGDLQSAITRATPKPAGVSLSPTAGSGAANSPQNFQTVWATTAGAPTIQQGYLLIQDSAVASPTKAQACLITVWSTGATQLADDSGTANSDYSWIGNSYAISPANQHCKLNGPSSALVVLNGLNLQTTLNLQFTQAWSGKTLSIWMAGQNSSYQTGPWKQFGTFTVR